jgi:hypothetical protein
LLSVGHRICWIAQPKVLTAKLFNQVRVEPVSVRAHSAY